MATQGKNLKHMVGQLFLVGFDGYSVPDEFKKLIQEHHLGGTIYFKRNVESPAQMAELSNEIQFGCRGKDTPGLFISIDHEGGVVTRVDKPFTKFPSNDFLGDMASPKVGFAFGAILGKELKAVGINVNFAPVVDVNSNPKSPIINTRAFSSDPEICARLGSAVSRGIQKSGVISVVKHFPGHGDTAEDSHLSLPKVTKSLDELEGLEFIPFRRAIRSRVEGIMTAHIINPTLDSAYPATMSYKTLTEILRAKLRFSRLIFSDDMEMKAIADNYGSDEAAILSVVAGCDVLIYRGDMDIHLHAMEAVIKAVESKRIPLKTIEDAYNRIQSSKKVYCDVTKPVDVTTVGKSIGLPEHQTLADCISRKEIPKNLAGGEDLT